MLSLFEPIKVPLFEKLALNTCVTGTGSLLEGKETDVAVNKLLLDSFHLPLP
jgi:hypothetical protein